MSFKDEARQKAVIFYVTYYFYMTASRTKEALIQLEETWGWGTLHSFSKENSEQRMSALSYNECCWNYNCKVYIVIF